MGGRLVAQHSYFNEWYVPGQQYLKLLVHRDGPYRVTMADLQNAGAPNLGSLLPDNLQLYYRGKEVPLHVQDDGQGGLSFFEFWGNRNDGRIDSMMYRSFKAPFAYDPEQQPNKHVSLFSDTSAYFLTWDATGIERLKPIQSTYFPIHGPQSSYRCKLTVDFLSTHYFGGGGSDDIENRLNPDYITGEGRLSNDFATGALADAVAYIFQTPGYINAGNPTRVEARLVATNNAADHISAVEIYQVEKYRDTTHYINIHSLAFDYLDTLRSFLSIRFRAYGQSLIPDYQKAAWASITYDRKYDLAGGTTATIVNYEQLDSTYMRFLHADLVSEAYLYDLTRKERIFGTVIGDTVKFLVPGSPLSRTLYVATDKALLAPVIEPTASLSNLSDPAAGAEFLIISHRAFANSAQQYAHYRDTNSVRPLTAKVAYIDEIFDEFGYGSFTPWAIKNFCQYALENWAVKPKYVLIWGKGRDCHRCDDYLDFIPTFGVPANDLEYVSNFRRDSVNLVPEAPIGRVSIKSDDEGLIYLAKVNEYEHLPYDNWMKQAVFMGGGKDDNEQKEIFFAMDSIIGSPHEHGTYKDAWEAPPLSGKVWYFQKRNNGIESNSPRSSEQQISAGAGVLHFFGHSAVNIFEVDILEPNQYTNFNRYPFIISFGCSGGNYATAAQSYGERTLIEPQRGAIGYLGNTTSGYLRNLADYGRHLYDTMFSTRMYGWPMGDILKETVRGYTQQYTADLNIYAANHAKQLNLQGDPAVAVRMPIKPDLVVRSPDIYFPNGNPSAFDKTFLMHVIVHNEGRNFTDSFVVGIRQHLPTGLTVSLATILHRPIDGVDTLKLTFPNDYGVVSAGYNRFDVTVDDRLEIDELREDNNTTTHEELFQGNIPAILFPAEYGIVKDQNIYLQASTFVMKPGSSVRYSFEIDTLSTFDSGFRKSVDGITGTTALGQWPLPFNLMPGQVYYWRARLTDYYPIQWNSSSFKYIPGKTGWSQARAPQFFKDPNEGMTLNQANHEWSFDAIRSQLHAYVLAFGSPGKAAYFLGPYGSDNDARAGVLYTPIDQHTLAPVIQNTLYGDWRLAMAASAPDHSELISSIQATRQGDYFLMVSSQDPRFADWSDATMHAFEMLGARYGDMRGLPNGTQMVFLGQKGAVEGSAIILTRPNLDLTNQSPQLDLFKFLSSPSGEGKVVSTVIGPSGSWENVCFDWHSTDAFPTDTLLSRVYGIRNDNTEHLLLHDIDSSLHALTSIDAAEYPRLRLVAQANDRHQYTAPQMDAWEVYHQLVPDVAVDASFSLVVPDTIVEGQLSHIRLMARNLTSYEVDSLLVRFYLQKPDRSQVPLGSKRYGKIADRDVRQIEFAFRSGGLGLEDGLITLIVELNPDGDQLEQYRFNNFLYHPVHVVTDKLGPLVDVTIDGRHVMEGDIISSEPEITIQVNDENPFLPVTVSDSTFKIWFGTERNYILNPQVFISGNNQIEKIPVKMPENKSQLVFTPGKLPDGEYTLGVQGLDTKGNQASKEPYLIHFNVVNEKSISDVLPYPNPFSSACHFVFTLTGNEKPNKFDIEIYTITGRLVKVIDLLSMDEVHFGYNITKYAWDGRDEFGDALANGTYLYKVNAKFDNPSTVTKRDEAGIGQFFHNGFGKMVLIR
jgi:hypothetical protein